MTLRLNAGAVLAFAVSVAAVGAVYASAWLPNGVPAAAAPVMIVAIATMMVAAMVLGSARHGRVGRLVWPFAGVWLLLVGGFLAALLLPPETAAAPGLWLGLPRRAAIVLYVIGVLPLVVMPFAYAATFDDGTLSAADLERLRAAAAEIIAAESAGNAGGDAAAGRDA